MVTKRDKIALLGNLAPDLVEAAGFTVAPIAEADLAVIDWNARYPELELSRWRDLRGGRPALALIGRTRLADRRAAIDAGVDDVVADLSNAADLRRLIALHLSGNAGGALELQVTPRAPLGRNERRILKLLSDARGRFVGEAELVASCWTLTDLNGPGKLRVSINRLRRALEPDPEWPTRIVNEPGLGYRLWPDRQPAEELPDS